MTSVGTDSVIWPSCEAVRAGLGVIDAFGQQVLPQLSPTAPRPRRSTTGTATGAVTSEARPSASSTSPTRGHLPVVDAVLSDCPQGRRLRHHRRGEPVGFAKRRDEMEHVVRQLLSGPVCASQREAALVRFRFSNGAAKLNPPFSSSRSKLGRPHRRCHGRRWRTPASCPAVAMSRRRSRCESPIGAHDQGVDSPNMAGFQLDGSLDIRLQSH